MLAGVLDHVQRPDGIDVEVGERVASCPVVRRLGGGVDHELDVGAVRPEQVLDRRTVADVEVLVGVGSPSSSSSAAGHPGGRRVVAEEHLAHVVVDTHDLHSETGEVLGGLGPDEAGGSGDERDGHVCFIVRSGQN